MYISKRLSRRNNFVLASYITTAFLGFSVEAAAQATSTPQSQGSLNDAKVRAERKERNPKVPRIEDLYRGQHHQKRKENASERKPNVPRSVNSRLKYGDNPETQQKSDALIRPSKISRSKANGGVMNEAAALAACDISQFASASGASLVNLLKGSTTDCVNSLFSVSGTNARSIFNESKMVTVADAVRNTAIGYNGTNSTSMLQLILFLRAGYYVNYYDSASTGTYGASLKSAVRSALDAFVANGNFGLVNNTHGEILSEFVTLIDSSSENARYLNSVVKRLLESYNSGHQAHWWMMTATNNVFTILFRGHQNADFQALVKSDSSILDTLYNFAVANFNLLGTDNDYLVINAGREIGRFLQYAESTTAKPSARAKAQLLINQSNITGKTAGLYVGLGEQVDYYDKGNCGAYNMCNFNARLTSEVLPISYSCSPTLRIKAQSMTSSQLAETCSTVAGQESYFHSKVASGKVSVANDNNTQLEMVVYASSRDYSTYAGATYGIDTNNGGMYLEGNPAAAGNQARFIAYQAEWLLPKFEIWNLTHEYVHYLDGRFNMYGDFAASTSVNSIWWIEGFAEYMSYGYRNLSYDAAKTQAAAGTYALSTIFRNDYNSGQTRVYNWGYLAARYMFEKQRPKVSSILGYFRPGNYAGYSSYLAGSSVGSSMDADFRNWLPCVSNPSLAQCGGTSGNNAPVANYSTTVSGLTVQFSNSSSDSDGSIASSQWDFGDGTSSTATNPTKTYASAGTYTVRLTVTDNQGLSSSPRSAQLTVGGGGTGTPECTGSAQELGRNCARSGLSATEGNYVYMYVPIPAGTRQVTITSSGGTGNADLYVSTLGTWATRSYYNYGSFNRGNNETVVVNNPPSGYLYVSLYGQSAFSGAQVKVQY